MSSLVQYNRVIWLEPPTHDVPPFRAPRAVLSKKSLRNINHSIDFIDNISEWKKIKCKENKKTYKYKLGFLTLTIPDDQLSPEGQKVYSKICKNPYCLKGFSKNNSFFIMTDLEVKNKLLNTYLQFLRDRYYLDVYMWKAEIQERGNIHFHIIINKFVWAKYLNNAWNRVLERNGLNGSPNCVDIHSIRKINNLKKYFSKYMTKNDTTRRPVVGKIWATSEYVSNYHGVTLTLNPQENEQFSEFMIKTTCKRFDAPYFH